MTDKTKQINEKGNIIFLKPDKQFTYEEIINLGLSGNSYRGFHKTEDSQFEPKKLFVTFFSTEKNNMLLQLALIN